MPALRFVPVTDLSAIDSIWTAGYVVRNHGYMVCDTLFATDAAFRIHPQMAERRDMVDDGRTATIRLREGLRFHDGAAVLAWDCVASIRCWAARDGCGQTLMAQTNELSAPDDRTIRFRLKAPFPLLAEALGKLSSPVPFMMPERLAQTDPQTQIKDAIGSGPFRFLKDECIQGSNAAWTRFDGYVPQNEESDGLSGGKVVNVQQVEWHTIPDPATAIAVMQQGQMDCWIPPRPVCCPWSPGTPVCRSPRWTRSALHAHAIQLPRAPVRRCAGAPCRAAGGQPDDYLDGGDGRGSQPLSRVQGVLSLRHAVVDRRRGGCHGRRSCQGTGDAENQRLWRPQGGSSFPSPTSH